MMPIKRRINPHTGAVEDQYVAEPGTSGAGDSGTASERTERQDASGLGSKVKGNPFKPPKMEQGESSSAYSARVAAARRAHEAAEIEGQKKALKGLK